jgi:hypothetical protein
VTTDSLQGTCFSALLSTTHIRVSTSDITTFSVIGSNKIFPRNKLFSEFNYLSVLEKTSSLILAGKGKAIPLQAWTGLEGSRSLRPSDFKTIST